MPPMQQVNELRDSFAEYNASMRTWIYPNTSQEIGTRVNNIISEASNKFDELRKVDRQLLDIFRMDGRTELFDRLTQKQRDLRSDINRIKDRFELAVQERVQEMSREFGERPTQKQRKFLNALSNHKISDAAQAAEMLQTDFSAQLSDLEIRPRTPRREQKEKLDIGNNKDETEQLQTKLISENKDNLLSHHTMAAKSLANKVSNDESCEDGTSKMYSNIH